MRAVTDTELLTVKQIVRITIALGYGILDTAQRMDVPLLSPSNTTVTKDVAFASDMGFRASVCVCGRGVVKSDRATIRSGGMEQPRCVIVGCSSHLHHMIVRPQRHNELLNFGAIYGRWVGRHTKRYGDLRRSDSYGLHRLVAS